MEEAHCDRRTIRRLSIGEIRKRPIGQEIRLQKKCEVAVEATFTCYLHLLLYTGSWSYRTEAEVASDPKSLSQPFNCNILVGGGSVIG
jgi:hypothetical protein